MTPSPGTINNPEGANGWEGFGDEASYGEATKQKNLKDAAPLAGGKIAAGALNTPRRSQRQAVRPVPAARAAHPTDTPQMQQLAAVAPPSVADVWREIAASPGAENYPILAELAELA